MIHQISNCAGDYNYNAYVYTHRFWDLHFHENYELIYSLDGNIEVSVGGVKVQMSTGDMILVPPNTVHSILIDNARIWVGVFSEEYITSFASENKYSRYSKFRCSPENDEYLRKNLFFQGKPERYITCACLYIVCSECLKNAVPENTGRDNTFIGETTKYIYENLKGEITLHDVCESLGYEYHYCSTLFNDIFAMNFKSFLNICRVSRACTLLRAKDIPITDVCDACGFGSIRNFNRVFKKISGITPSEYRLQNTK